MIIKIAIGILLGFILMFVLCVVVAVISAGIVTAQERIQKQKPIHVRLRPEKDNYKRMQELKQKARTQHPEHWKEENR